MLYLYETNYKCQQNYYNNRECQRACWLNQRCMWAAYQDGGDTGGGIRCVLNDLREQPEKSYAVKYDDVDEATWTVLPRNSRDRTLPCSNVASFLCHKS